MPAPYPENRKAARKALEDLLENKAAVRVIHYSCESFDDVPSGQSPRITSIAVRRLDSGQTESFSIHRAAELQSVDPSQIIQHYDELERAMLDDFAAYVKSQGEVSFLHWNMRDANYGFSAIEHRHKVLKGVPAVIPETRRFDLSRILLDLYGTAYIPHERLEQLAKKNEITMLRFLSGKVEAEKFRTKEYVALHQSTLRKVDILSDIAERAYRRTLKTDSGWWTQNGGSIRGLWDWIVNNASILFILTLLGVILTVAFFFVGVHFGALAPKGH